MEEQELLDLIKLGEGQHIEFKASFSSQNEAIEALCAFRNSEGGKVILGVAPDGTVKGVTLGKNTLESFANNVRDNSEPRMHPSIVPFVLSVGQQIVLVSIERISGDVQYAFHKPLIRVGRTNQLMSAQQQKEVYRRATSVPPTEAIPPTELRLVRQNPLTRVPRLTLGINVLKIVAGAYAFSFEHDELESEEEVALVGGFLQQVSDLGELYDELGPADHTKAAFMLRTRPLIS